MAAIFNRKNYVSETHRLYRIQRRLTWVMRTAALLSTLLMLLVFITLDDIVKEPVKQADYSLSEMNTMKQIQLHMSFMNQTKLEVEDDLFRIYRKSQPFNNHIEWKPDSNVSLPSVNSLLRVENTLHEVLNPNSSVEVSNSVNQLYKGHDTNTLMRENQFSEYRAKEETKVNSNQYNRTQENKMNVLQLHQEQEIPQHRKIQQVIFNTVIYNANSTVVYNANKTIIRNESQLQNKAAQGVKQQLKKSSKTQEAQNLSLKTGTKDISVARKKLKSKHRRKYQPPIQNTKDTALMKVEQKDLKEQPHSETSLTSFLEQTNGIKKNNSRKFVNANTKHLPQRYAVINDMNNKNKNTEEIKAPVKHQEANSVGNKNNDKQKAENKKYANLPAAAKFPKTGEVIKPKKVITDDHPNTDMPDFNVAPTVEDIEPLNTGNHLMIMSYMRSGSSMNGKIFRDSNDDFYVYEPLIKFAPFHYLTENRFCKMREPKCSRKDLQGFEVGDRIETTIRALKNIYSCNIRRLDDRILRSIMFENQSGKVWSDFTQCYISVAENKVQLTENLDEYLYNAKTKNFDKHDNIFRYLYPPGPRADLLNTCLEKLETKCRTSSLKVTKVLRLSLRLIPRLLNLFPKLKIFFVLRDPRGIVNSRIQTPWFPVNESKPVEVTDNIKSLCYKMDSDVKMVQIIKKDFPGRLLDFRLEDIAQSPLETFESVFNFMNVTITDNHVKNIKEIFKEKPNFQTKWVTSLRSEYIRLTEDVCGNVFKYYNYYRMYF